MTKNLVKIGGLGNPPYIRLLNLFRVGKGVCPSQKLEWCNYVLKLILFVKGLI